MVHLIAASTVQTKLLSTSGLLVGLGVLYLVLLLFGRALMRRYEKDGHLETKERRYLTMWNFLRRVALVVVLILAVPIIFTIWEIDMASLLAVAGAIGVAIGFGAQSMVRDVLAGFLILAENQYRIGDTVTVRDVTGKVEDIRVRLTVLRDQEGNVHYVPNGLIEVASNLTQEYAQTVIDLAIEYGADVDRAIAVVSDELGRFVSDPEWEDGVLGEPKVMGVEQLGDFAVVIRSAVKVKADQRHPVRRELLRRFKNRLDSEGIGIPFPTRTVHVAGGESSPSA